MITENERALSRSLGTLFDGGTVAGLSDGQLLERFCTRRGDAAETAFAALMLRHGPMVLRVCRLSLRDGHEAEDAFQRTFLVLVRRGRSLWVRDSIGPWLYTVALRVCSDSRWSSRRRKLHELQAAKRARTWAENELFADDLASVVQEEVGRLPSRQRAVVVLCDLEGLTHEEAARRLRWPVGTIKSRLFRARERLRGRLARRGLAPSVALLGAALSADAGEVSKALAASTLRAAVASAPRTLGALAWLGWGGLLFARYKGIAMVLAVALGAVVCLLNGSSDDVPAKNGPPGKLQLHAQVSVPRPSPARSTDEDAVRLLLREADGAVASIREPIDRARLRIALGTIRSRSGERDRSRADFALAIREADSSPDTYRRTYCLEDVALAQEDAGDREVARATLQHAQKTASTMDAFKHSEARMWMTRTQFKTGDVDGAFRTIQELGGESIWKGQGLKVILECVKGKEKATVQEVAKRVLGVADTLADYHKTWALEAVAEALADAGDFEGARSVVETLQAPVSRFGLKDGRSSYSNYHRIFAIMAIASAKARQGQRESAARDFESAVAAALNPFEAEAHRSANVGRVVEAQAEAGDLAGALKSVEFIVYEFYKAKALATIAMAQANAGDATRARTTFGRALLTAGAIHKRDRLQDRDGSHYLDASDCRREIAILQARAGLVDDALLTVEGLANPRRGNAVRSYAAAALAERGDVVTARKYADKITDEKTRHEAYQLIAKAQADRGDLSKALEWAIALEPGESRASALKGLAEAVALRPRGNASLPSKP
jgi:RNA polymerase sigma factor (sigma-70 family)